MVDESELFSRCNWSPFSGTRFSHCVDLTMVSGQVAYAKGKPADEPAGRRVEFAKQRNRRGPALRGPLLLIKSD